MSNTERQERILEFQKQFSAVVDNISKVIKGKREVIEHVLTALTAGGHVMLLDVPGTGKTSLIFSLASELKMNIAIMSFTSEMNDNILMRCFRRIPENCILVIEDIDALFESRKKNDDLKNNITFIKTNLSVI